ncbi:oligosaccharide flippase family protein [Parafilimonas sp.]|uniref:oligosaccharide flippase family protein n=1 Tax=Parafilimonas sp. TaxID=1969739 RepID=UPI0039E42CB8
MVKKKQVIQSGAWQMLNVSIKVFSQFGYYAVMARLLHKSELGVFALLNSFMNFGNMIGDGGMGDALLQRKETDKQHVNAAFFSGMLLAAIIYIAIFIIAPFAAAFYKEPQLTSSLRIFSIIFWFAAMYAPSFAMLQKNFRFKKIFIADGVMLLLSNVLGIALAYCGYGVMSLVWSQIFYFGAELLTLLLYYPLPLKAGCTKKHWKDLAGYGSGLTLIRVNNYIVNFGIILEVGKLVTASVLGVFDRSFRIMNIPQRFIYDMVQRVMMPAMVKKNDNAKGTYKVFSKSLSLINSALVPLTVFLIVFSRQIVLVLLGKKWMDAVPLLQVFFLNLPLRTTASLGDTLMRVHGLIKLNLIRKVQNSIIICVFIYIGYLLAGLTGISWSIFVSTLISYIMMMAIVRTRIFQNDWRSLVYKPYYNGVMLSIYWVAPAYFLYRLLHLFIADEIIAFAVLCAITGGAATLAFIKKPKLLGSDIVYIQKDFMQMFAGKKRLKKSR